MPKAIAGVHVAVAKTFNSINFGDVNFDMDWCQYNSSLSEMVFFYTKEKSEAVYKKCWEY